MMYIDFCCGDDVGVGGLYCGGLLMFIGVGFKGGGWGYGALCDFFVVWVFIYIYILSWCILHNVGTSL